MVLNGGVLSDGTRFLREDLTNQLITDQLGAELKPYSMLGEPCAHSRVSKGSVCLRACQQAAAGGLQDAASAADAPWVLWRHR